MLIPFLAVLVVGPPVALSVADSSNGREQTVFEAREGEVFRLRPRERARLDELTVLYESGGEKKTAQREYKAITMIRARSGSHSAERLIGVREPWVWNGYVIEVVRVDSIHGPVRIRLRHRN